MAERADNSRKLLGDLLPDHPNLAGTLELVWHQAEKAFPGVALRCWVECCRRLADGPLGSAGTLAYARAAPACALIVGPEGAVALAATAEIAAREAGGRAGVALGAMAPKAARLLRTAGKFAEWLRVVERLAPLAPESLAALLERSETLLAELDVRGYEAWALGGVRAAAGDPDKRLRFFRLMDQEARRQLAHDTGTVGFTDVEERLKMYFSALWGTQPLIRAARGQGGEPVRRTGFGEGFIRVPETFRGFAGRRAADVFRASLAHVGAHFRFTTARFRVGSLKPVQIALVSLIEDARVEQLALRDFPGLRRLWLPFHVAEPSGALTAAILMARLARALIDPDFKDDNVWVAKGRQMFLDRRDRWEDQSISREIGNLLGNDLGQMRVQFNARTYVVEPAYRDDNMGLWDFGDGGEMDDDVEMLFESARFDRIEGEGEDSEPDQTEQDEGDEGATRAAVIATPEEDVGIPVARYPEWDYLIGRDRPGWTTVVEHGGRPGRAGQIERILERHAGLVNRITALIRSAKVSRPMRLRRQPEGDYLDLDACIAAIADRRLGMTPDPRVYGTFERRHRDLSALVLLDISQSTNDLVPAAGESVLALEREATALVAHAMDGLGNPFALRAFCSNGREEVRYYHVKDFDEPFAAMAKLRLAGLEGRLSTRIGAAMRHAGSELSRRRNHRRLLLVVTDGEPSDVDVGDRKYLVEDARKAVLSLRHAGIDVFCVGLEAGGDSYLSRIFGRHNVLQIDRLQQLPEKLPMLYLRLTA